NAIFSKKNFETLSEAFSVFQTLKYLAILGGVTFLAG
uniref:Dolichyl-diphosphooligosaccharide--protein glycosyltransferase subunit 2 (Fragments) n=1 Tax=Gallus gallus TaxID=9031 RepID=RPN2_CHICK|nr:RecName: Full=Dolichyl-diphosphooligosaccharide--protein glycosyltransferase subunit 2; AltName: Full=Dolichyl-diphosphooligosaccharide--protein glycosyltransferase 65-II kDa subunit; AltName: Full=Ribophorin II; Short=RPN-II; AltName: Full=Ribophorin-2 [Gallus gallus]